MKFIVVSLAVVGPFSTWLFLAANFEQDDQECTEGKQQYFGQCCDVSSVIVSQPSSGSMVPASSPSGPTSNNPTQPTTWGQAPSGNFTWIPSGGQHVY